MAGGNNRKMDRSVYISRSLSSFNDKAKSSGWLFTRKQLPWLKSAVYRGPLLRLGKNTIIDTGSILENGD